MKRSIGIMLLALVAAMSFLGVAVATEVAGQPEATMPAPMVVVDEAAGTISIALPIEGELPECGADPTAAEASSVDTGTYGPGDCIELVIEHPSGKTHHGAIVSTVAKELDPTMLDGIKKGEIMRWVAKGGNGDDDDDDENEGGEGSEGGGSEGGGSEGGSETPETPGNNGNGNGSGNNGNGSENSGNGNGNGSGDNGNGNGSENSGNGNGNGSGDNGNGNGNGNNGNGNGNNGNGNGNNG